MGTMIVLLCAAMLIGLGLLLGITGWASPGIDVYQHAGPKVDIREYFHGRLVAFGTIQDISGKVLSHFTATLHGDWQGNRGTLSETFTFDDGKIEQREWQFTVNEDGSFIGNAHDIAGDALGKQSGNAVFMKYTLKRNVGGRTLHFTMDDRLYLVDGSHMINQTKMKKFGITVAELNIGFHKVV